MIFVIAIIDSVIYLGGFPSSFSIGCFLIIPISSSLFSWLHCRVASNMFASKNASTFFQMSFDLNEHCAGFQRLRIRAGSPRQRGNSFFLARDRLNGNKYSVHSALESNQEPRRSIITTYDALYSIRGGEPIRIPQIWCVHDIDRGSQSE